MDETRKVQAIEVGVAIRRDARFEAEPVGVQTYQLFLPCVAGRPAFAVHAAHPVEPAMQVDHPRAAGGLMQTVDILRDELLGFAARLQPGEGAVGIVGQGLAEAPPAQQAARPIAPLGHLLAHEGLEGHRRRAFPLALRVTIIGNA